VRAIIACAAHCSGIGEFRLASQNGIAVKLSGEQRNKTTAQGCGHTLCLFAMSCNRFIFAPFYFLFSLTLIEDANKLHGESLFPAHHETTIEPRARGPVDARTLVPETVFRKELSQEESKRGIQNEKNRIVPAGVASLPGDAPLRLG
jgi:hypothetical protein